MKLSFFFVLFFSVAIGFGQDSTFTLGNEAYAAGDYKNALSSYNQLVADEIRSVDLYYNLGNTYYRLNEWGKAVWAYERALEIDPSHENTHYNLDLVNQQTKAELNVESGGISNWLKANIYGISINFWPYFTLSMAFTFSIVCYFFFTTKKQKMKNITLSLSLLTLTLLVGGFILSTLNTSHLTNQSNGIIIVNSANILAEPSVTSTTNFSLKEGAKIQLLRTNSDWIEIDFKGHSGWVLREEIWEI